MVRLERRLGAMLIAGLLGAQGVAGCGEDDDPMGGGPAGDAGRLDGGLDGSTGDSGPTGNIDGGGSTMGDGSVVTPPPPPPVTCPAESARPTEVLRGPIMTNTTLDCNKTYLLGNYVYVKNGATLTIRPGTIIKGDPMGALLITREGKIDAQGTKEQPIVFTSFANPGMRTSGGWQGIVLMGKADLNLTTVDREFEGLTTNNADNRYGGMDDAHNCGTMRYVRIEFAGHELMPNRELNSLSVCGCGSQTTLEYLQMHKGKDDAIEFFGGTASAKYLVFTGTEDDNVDWDEGWRGRLQFVAAQQHDVPASGDSNGFEASNRAMEFGAMPIAAPKIYNVTLIGDRMATHPVRSMLFKEGTRGEIRNILAQGFATVGIEVTSKESADALRANPPSLSVANSIFFGIGAGGSTYFPLQDMAENMADDGLDESAVFRNPAWNNRFDMDPMLADPYNLNTPGWVPPATSIAASGAATPPSDGWFDTSATFVGAFKPGAPDWTAGWTAYPAN